MSVLKVERSRLQKLSGFNPHIVRLLGNYIVATILTFAGSTGLQAQQTTSPQSLDTQVLQQQIDHLAAELRALQAQLSALQKAQTAPSAPGQNPAAGQVLAQNPAPPVKPHGAPDSAPGATTPSATGVNPLDVATATIGQHQPTTAEQQNHRFFERKPGKDLTFFTKNGELTLYGNLDVSFDVMTKGTSNLLGPDGLGPVGNVGWMPVSRPISLISGYVEHRRRGSRT